MPFRVGPGDVQRLIIRFPKFISAVQAIEASGANDDSSFIRGCTDDLGLANLYSNSTGACPNGDPQAFMLDMFNNTNKTSSGEMRVALLPGVRNQGTQMVGELMSPVVEGQGLFRVLQIACPGIGFQLEFSYTGNAGLTVSDVSDPFDVMPAPPRLQTVLFDPTFTHLYFYFTKDTDRGAMPLLSNCLDFLGGIGYWVDDSGEQLYDSLCSGVNITNATEYVAANATNSTPAIYGTRFTSTERVSCALSALIGGSSASFPPMCSWKDKRTMVLRLGRSIPGSRMIQRLDSVFLRPREDGLQIGHPRDPLGSFFASLPMKTLQGPVCVGDTCGGHSVLSSTSFSAVEWSCANSNPDIEALCTPGLFGLETQDIAFFQVRGVEYAAVASYCAGSISAISRVGTCLSQGSERAVIVYQIMMSEEENPKPGLYEYQLLHANGPVDLLTFTIPTDFTSAPVLLAVVQYFDGSGFGLEVTIYEWSESQEFVKIQSIPTDGARSVTTAEYGNQHYLFIAQENRDSMIMIWQTGAFVASPDGKSLVWRPGAYVEFLSFSKPGASSVKQWTSGDDWFVGFANFKIPEPGCSGVNLTCGSFKGSVDVYKIGFKTRIEEFIPYPCNRNQDACIQDEWCLTRTYANITLENPSDDSEVLTELTVGSFVLLDDEIMRIIDAEISSEAELFSLQRGDINFAWTSMQEMEGDLLTLDLKDLMQRPAGWFRVPPQYREAWAVLSGDRARVSKFYQLAEPITGRVSFKPTSPVAVDLDLDGLQDMVVGVRDGSLRFLRNMGGGVFEPMALSEAPQMESGFSAPAFADLDGDGITDMVVGAADGTLRSFRRGSGQQCRNQTSCSNTTNSSSALEMSFTAIPFAEDPLAGIYVTAFSKPAFADLNGDMLVDLILGSEDGRIRLYMNNGTASTPLFVADQRSSILLTTSVSSHSAPTVWDVDGDNDLDVVVGSSDGRLYLFERSGPDIVDFVLRSPTSVQGLPIESLGERSSPAFFDLNGYGNETALCLGHILGDAVLYKQETAGWVEMGPGSESVLGEEAVRLLHREDFYKVFTGFGCMRGVCNDCSSASPLRCQNDNCNGINSDFSTISPRSSNCISYYDANPESTYDICCEPGLHGSFRPCRRSGHITVERAMRDTLAAEPGACIFEDASASGLITIASCDGQDRCICSGGSNDGQDCRTDRGCQAHNPGTRLYIVPEDVLAANDHKPILELPTLGAKDFVPLEIEQTKLVVVANHFSGCGARGFNLDSVVYVVNYDDREYYMQHSFSSSGASGILPFTREEEGVDGEIKTRQFLLLANYRDQYDLTTVSTLYEWIQPEQPTCGNESANCTAEEPGQKDTASAFIVADSIMTDGAIRWIQFDSDILGKQRFVAVSSATGRSIYTESPVYSFASRNPQPIVVVDSPPVRACAMLCRCAQSVCL